MPPAARMGDATAHGGTIVVGFPMVLIGGQPAARVGDMHACPMQTPGVPPIPHVGGPILPPELRTIAQLLKEKSVSAVARELGMTRKVLRMKLAEIREYFIAADIDHVF